ncbi:MAG: hypothetical protein OXG46_05850 [Chloroflexi bacterium]|nr:hypothetical protein [Chloroflexota bacterium]MCY3937865.1 hypothetical protein [Chloroflexota bacterium]
MTVSPVWRLAEWTGRCVLLGAVAFWWGAIVGPELFGLSFPSVLPTGVPLQLNPDSETSVGNAVSAASLLIVAILTFGNLIGIFGKLRDREVGLPNTSRGWRRLSARDWIAAGGWLTLALAAAYLAWKEMDLSSFRSWFVPGAGGADFRGPDIGGRGLVLAQWGFVLAMAVFIGKGTPRVVRVPLALGVAAWLFALIYDMGNRIVPQDWTYTLNVLLEETLEFSGALLIAVGAALGLLKGRGPVPQGFSGRRLLRLAIGSIAVVVVLGGVVAFEAVFSYREKLVDTRGRVVFNVNLHDDYSLVQELGTFSTPPARLRLRMTNRDPRGNPGVMLWRVMEADEGGSGRILREGRIEVAARDEPRWANIDFPPLVEAEGRPLAVQLVAEVEPEAYLRIGGTKTDSLENLRLWVQGAETWPDQKLELAAYGPSDLTRSKLAAMWSHSTWSWPALAVGMVFGLWTIAFFPALLVTAALPRRGLPQ